MRRNEKGRGRICFKESKCFATTLGVGKTRITNDHSDGCSKQDWKQDEIENVLRFPGEPNVAFDGGGTCTATPC